MRRHRGSDGIRDPYTTIRQRDSHSPLPPESVGHRSFPERPFPPLVARPQSLPDQSPSPCAMASPSHPARRQLIILYFQGNARCSKRTHQDQPQVLWDGKHVPQTPSDEKVDRLVHMRFQQGL